MSHKLRFLATQRAPYRGDNLHCRVEVRHASCQRASRVLSFHVQKLMHAVCLTPARYMMEDRAFGAAHEPPADRAAPPVAGTSHGESEVCVNMDGDDETKPEATAAPSPTPAAPASGVHRPARDVTPSREEDMSTTASSNADILLRHHSGHGSAAALQRLVNGVHPDHIRTPATSSPPNLKAADGQPLTRPRITIHIVGSRRHGWRFHHES